VIVFLGEQRHPGVVARDARGGKDVPADQPGMRTRAFPTSTSIAGSQDAASPAAAVRAAGSLAINTWANPAPGRTLHLGEPCRGSQLLAPAIDRAWRNIGATRNLTNDGARGRTLGNNRPFLILAPASPTLRAGNYLKSRHRTVACTAASTIMCTGAKT
jgi:hypothetical protein